MLAKDLMRKKVRTIGDDESVSDLLELFVGEHIHGAPVLDDAGKLVGVVTQQDLFFATMTRGSEGGELARPDTGLKVRDIMTSPAVSASEETEVLALCKLMHKLRIHRVPITRDGKVTGIISSLDVCGALARGDDL